jgi:hypothetical protein
MVSAKQFYASFQPDRNKSDQSDELLRQITAIVTKYNTFVDAVLASQTEVYLGIPGSDGSWKFAIIGNDLKVLRCESGQYVVKETISA